MIGQGAKMIEDRYKPFAEYAETGVEGIKRTGIKVLEMRNCYAKVLMPMAGNGNHVGMMYAGSLFTLGEFSGGIIHGAAFDINKFFPIVVDVYIRFRRPALTDVTIEVELTREEADAIQQEAEEKGKANFVMDLDIKDAQGETVSLVKGTWQIRKIPEGMDNPLSPG